MLMSTISLATKLYFSSLAEPGQREKARLREAVGLRAHAHVESDVCPPNQNAFPTPMILYWAV